MNAERDSSQDFERFDFAIAQVFETDIPSDLDPRLQWMLARHQAGEVLQATASTGRNEIGVIAKVTDASAWESLSEVRAPIVIGAIAADVIVTGRIPVSRIGSVRSQPFVKSLKASRALHPQLDKTTLDTKARPDLLPVGQTTNGGSGVIVGIIDYGGDFAHDNFRNSDGSSRLLYLWNQNAAANATSPYGYGKEFNHIAITAALQTAHPYATLQYDPADYEDPDDPGSHGTHVMDIAAGNGRGTSVPGMAPDAKLIFVNISHQNDPVGTAVIGKSLGFSMQLLEAALYIFEKAGETPCVINISLGTNGGPHDGTTLVEQGLDALVKAKSNRAIVLAAGNSFDDGIHLTGTVDVGVAYDVKWKVVSRPRRDIEMEIWYKANNRFSVELLDSTGVVRASVAPGQSQTLLIANKVVFIANRIGEPNNGDNMINIFLAKGIDSGTYTVRLHGDQVTDGRFHAWIERDNTRSSKFEPSTDGSYTIGSVSCGHSTISVGSYDAHKSARTVSWFSSAGPTRDERKKPEVSAPGQDVLAALSSSGHLSRRMSGTSMAAPAVSGLVALMFAQASRLGLSLNIEQVRDILIETARPIANNADGWDPQLGNGRVDANAAIQKVIALANAQLPSGNPLTAARLVKLKDKAKNTPKIGKKPANKEPP